MPPKIAVISHPVERFESRPTFLREIAKIWDKRGIDVYIVYAPHVRFEADLAILHIDLTVIPQAYVDLGALFPKCLNGAVPDISKRVISNSLVLRDDGYDGPVIVKSNLNNRGNNEAFILAKARSPNREFASAGKTSSTSVHVTQGQKVRKEAFMPILEYQILDSAKQVSPAVWDNRDLVVERFLPERSQDLYCLRTWVFLGDKETNSICYCDQPVVKSDRIVRRQQLSPDEIPDDLRALRRQLKFDYGKFDYAIIDGRAVLYDANRTPSLGAFSREQFLPNLELLAAGIDYYL
jgi:hypothetical protein